MDSSKGPLNMFGNKVSMFIFICLYYTLIISKACNFKSRALKIMEKIVIVMPVWNEAENVKEMVDVLVKNEFPKIQANMQLLIVDNHSTDGTDKIAGDFSKKYKNVHIIQQKNKG